MSVQTFLIINYSTKYIGRSTGLIELLVNTLRTFFALISDHLRQLLIPYKMSRFIFLDTHQLSYSIICRKSREGKNLKNNMNVYIFCMYCQLLYKYIEPLKGCWHQVKTTNNTLVHTGVASSYPSNCARGSLSRSGWVTAFELFCWLKRPLWASAEAIKIFNVR